MGVISPFCRHQHNFLEGRQYLDSHFPFNERSQTKQGETPLLFAIIGPHNIRRQHFLMLQWVLLCNYCSYFYHLPKTSEPGRAIQCPHHCRCLLPRSLPIVQSMFLCRIVFCLYYHRPRGHCSCLHQHFSHLLSELHHTSMGHARLVCTQFSIFCTPLRRSGPIGSFFLQRITLNGPTISLSYKNILSRRNIDGFRLYVCS
jgi:hypothetical protein